MLYNNKLNNLYRIFVDAQRLKQLIADHNEIRELPGEICNSILEEINLHHNLLEKLPEDFLANLNKWVIIQSWLRKWVQNHVLVFIINHPLSVRGWTSAFLLPVHRLCAAIEGRLGHFLLAQDRLTECDQPGKNPLKYSAAAGNWTRATGRTDSELSHWAIMTDFSFR